MLSVLDLSARLLVIIVNQQLLYDAQSMATYYRTIAELKVLYGVHISRV